jgi:undecaprenyl-diphosphatase
MVGRVRVSPNADLRLVIGRDFHFTRGVPDWIEVILLGIIEGITEFLPISSTGHLLIAQRWLAPRSDLFNVVIQVGAVLAVLPLFPERLRQFANCWRNTAGRDYLLKMACAFGITGAGGLLLERSGFKLPEEVRPVAVALLVGGVLFIGVERLLRGRPQQTTITWTVAVVVGFGQLLAAIFPGTSRSGSTILLALCLGLSRPAATEFSFLVGIPTMLAAGSLKLFQGLRQTPADAVPEDWGLLILGSLVAAVVSFVVVRWLLRFVQTHTFEGFGWYRVGLGVLLLLLVA